MASWSVEILGSDVWRPYLDNLLSHHPLPMARTAKTLISSLHNRHVPITPRLAVELVPLLVQPTSTEWVEGVWSTVLQRLSKALSPNQTGASKSAGLLLGAAPAHTLIRLVQPIILEACKRQGMGILFAEDPIPGGMAAGPYHAWSEKMHHEVARIAEDTTGLSTFWADRALALAHVSNLPSSQNQSHGLPRLHAPSLAVLLGLETHNSPVTSRSRHPKPLQSPQKHRESVRLKEGGVHGVKMSRRLQDMGEMLIAEFMHHPVVQADRLLNSGYLSYRREPRREQIRDVLVVGIMPHSAQTGPAAAFARICWLEFCARLAYILCRNNMNRSEFRWLEGDRAGGVRQSGILLKDLPQTHPGEQETPHQQWREAFFKTAARIPEFLDENAPFQYPPEDHLSQNSDPKTDEWWIRQVWTNQRDHRRWTLDENRQNRGGQAQGGLSQTSWSNTHVMVFQSANKKGLSAHGLHQKLRFKRRSGLSLTHTPQEIQSGWYLESHKAPARPLIQDQRTSVNGLASDLVQGWLDLVVKEIRHG